MVEINRDRQNVLLFLVACERRLEPEEGLGKEEGPHLLDGEAETWCKGYQPGVPDPPGPGVTGSGRRCKGDPSTSLDGIAQQPVNQGSAIGC